MLSAENECKGSIAAATFAGRGGLTSVFIANGISEQQRGERHTHYTSMKFSLQTGTHNVGNFEQYACNVTTPPTGGKTCTAAAPHDP
jgi:hypothetical protein